MHSLTQAQCEELLEAQRAVDRANTDRANGQWLTWAIVCVCAMWIAMSLA